jgi:hypothetical protein
MVNINLFPKKHPELSLVDLIASFVIVLSTTCPQEGRLPPEKSGRADPLLLH